MTLLNTFFENLKWNDIIIAIVASGLSLSTVLTIVANKKLKKDNFKWEEVKKYKFEQKKLAFEKLLKVISKLNVVLNYDPKNKRGAWSYTVHVLEEKSELNLFIEEINELLGSSFWFSEMLQKEITELSNQFYFYNIEHEEIKALSEASGIGLFSDTDGKLSLINEKLRELYKTEFNNLEKEFL